MFPLHLPPLRLVVFCSQLAFLSDCRAAPDAFIPPKFKGIILYAPVPDYPMEARNRYTLGAHGIYRLKINQQTGAVDEVSVLKRASAAKLNAVMVFELFKWKFKPGAVKQLDIPVEFESDIRAELKNAAAR
ncbi:MAG: hypothetical protein QOH31_4661 [Verrucomicrobiota bacterium]